MGGECIADNCPGSVNVLGVNEFYLRLPELQILQRRKQDGIYCRQKNDFTSFYSPVAGASLLSDEFGRNIKNDFREAVSPTELTMSVTRRHLAEWLYYTNRVTIDR